MLLTDEGISIFFRFSHFSKALSPILLTPFGIIIEVRFLQLKKAESPMLIKLLGREICPNWDSKFESSIKLSFTSLSFKEMSSSFVSEVGDK